MNNERIVNFLDELLGKYEQTPSLLEQKEELLTHLTERVQDHMEKGLAYDEAFNATIRDLGDVRALVEGIAPKRGPGHKWGNWEHESRTAMPPKKRARRNKGARQKIALALTCLSPFVYVLIGLQSSGWQFWAWGWVIIPLSSLIFVGDWRAQLVSSTPFIYFLLGWVFGWWAWAWVIIPMSSLIFVNDWRAQLVSSTPFIYFLLGWVFGWWAWAWVIIPISAIVFVINNR